MKVCSLCVIWYFHAFTCSILIHTDGMEYALYSISKIADVCNVSEDP